MKEGTRHTLKVLGATQVELAYAANLFNASEDRALEMVKNLLVVGFTLEQRKRIYREIARINCKAGLGSGEDAAKLILIIARLKASGTI